MAPMIAMPPSRLMPQPWPTTSPDQAKLTFPFADGAVRNVPATGSDVAPFSSSRVTR